MKSIMQAVVVAGFATLALTGAARAQITENGPYYTTPSWDQQIPAVQRFIVLTNWSSQAVLDRETGLVWQRTPLGADPQGNLTTWQVALSDCHTLVSTGGRFGWRLPSLEELLSLVDPTTLTSIFFGYSVPAGSPFIGVSPQLYWTATTIENHTYQAYVVSFDLGASDIDGFATPTVNFAKSVNTPGSTTSQVPQIWCVRGGTGVQNPQ